MPEVGAARRRRLETMTRVCGLALLLLLALGTPAPAAQELTVSAAVSMRDAMRDIAGAFAAQHPGVQLRLNFGSSGELQKQIEAGAPVDVFVSAGSRQMDELERRGLVDTGTRRVFARNVLVVVRPADSRLDLSRPESLLDPKVTRIVIGNPRTVPAGQYAEESLRGLGLWNALQRKLVLAENVRQALDYVARGEVAAGFVYATDAAVRRGQVTEAFRPAEDTYRPVTYPAAVVAATRQPALSRALVEFLGGDEARAVLARLGFGGPPPAR
jgi:molybdate transport system substrate-binding protein